MCFMIWNLCLEMAQIINFAMTDHEVLQTRKWIFHKSLLAAAALSRSERKCEVVQANIPGGISQDEPFYSYE